MNDVRAKLARVPGTRAQTGDSTVASTPIRPAGLSGRPNLARSAGRLAAAAAVFIALFVSRACADDAVPSTGAAPAATARRPGASLLYFFSPDWRPPDLGALGAAVEKTLSASGVPVSFQAFTRYEDFEHQLIDSPPAFLIAPAWLGTNPAATRGLALTVLARPLHHGKDTYRKALMTRPGIDSIDDLARGSIAATLHSMSNGSPDVVLGAFHLAVDSARVVPVPKDVDALLALSFGQVDAALVTSKQYDDLERTRPAEAERLRVLAFSPEVGLPPLFATPQADPAVAARLRDAFVRLADLPDGAAILSMLGFDRFAADGSGARSAAAEAGGTTAAAAGTASASPPSGAPHEGASVPHQSQAGDVSKHRAANTGTVGGRATGHRRR